MRAPRVPVTVNGGGSVIRADVAEAMGIRPHDRITYAQLREAVERAREKPETTE